MVNKVLLYSTGNSTKYCIITYKGKESEKVCVCVCVCVYTYMPFPSSGYLLDRYPNHFARYLKLTPYFKSHLHDHCCLIKINK